MQKEYKKVNIDKIEDLHEDLADMMEDANEIQEVMGKSRAAALYLSIIYRKCDLV